MFLIFCTLLIALCFSTTVKIKALILPKFEIGEIVEDFPGEAQKYFEYFFQGHNYTKYTIKNTPEPLYVNEIGVAIIVTLMGKAQSGQTVATVFADNRFDWSDALIISTGCAGSPPERTVLGDVILGGVVIDHELGHGNDKEDVPSGGPLFVRDVDYDEGAITWINESLLNWAYELTRNISLAETNRSVEVVNAYAEAYEGKRHIEKRVPKVQIGGILTGDNYWAGITARERVEEVFAAYQDKYNYTITEMEDSAIGVAVKRAGLQNQFLIIRDSVDYDIPLPDASILEFWGETSQSKADYDWGIFETARENNFKVGKVIIGEWLLKKKAESSTSSTTSILVSLFQLLFDLNKK